MRLGKSTPQKFGRATREGQRKENQLQGSRYRGRIITHQACSPTGRSQQIKSSKQKRAITSEAYSDYLSSSFKKLYKEAVVKLSHSFAIRPGKQKKSSGNQRHLRSRYSRSEGKYKQKELSDPWGGPAIAKGIFPKKSSKERLEEQRKQLQNLTQMKSSMEERSFVAASVIKFKSQKPFSRPLTKVRKRAVDNYLQFIGGQGSYNIGFDFQYLRSLDRCQAEQMVDFGISRIFESILLCIADVLKGEQVGSHGAYKLLREYSLLYFRLFQKILSEFVIYYHIFKLCQSRVISFLVYSRICMFFLHQAAVDETALTEKFRKFFESALLLMVGISKLLYEGHSEGEKRQGFIVETLKNLKLTSSIDKKIGEFVGNVSKLQSFFDKNQMIRQVMRELTPLTKDLNLGGLQLQLLAQTECGLAWKFFAIPPIPYLPPKPPSKPYTLILTLNFTLTFFNSQTGVIHFRPYLDLFLEKVFRLFELIVWSDQEKPSSDKIVNAIEKGVKFFSFRLYSEHFSLKEGVLGRDLTRLGRATEQTLLLDVKKQLKGEGATEKEKPEKGVILVNPFLGDRNDSQLLRVLSRLQWMCDGFPASIIDREPLHLDTLQHIEQQLQQGTSISIH